MNKYDIVLDLVEHPEKYSSEQIAEILSDSEAKEIYDLLCQTTSAMQSDSFADTEANGKNLRANTATFQIALPSLAVALQQ